MDLTTASHRESGVARIAEITSLSPRQRQTSVLEQYPKHDPDYQQVPFRRRKWLASLVPTRLLPFFVVAGVLTGVGFCVFLIRRLPLAFGVFGSLSPRV
jgi:hypothetical protein